MIEIRPIDRFVFDAISRYHTGRMRHIPRMLDDVRKRGMQILESQRADKRMCLKETIFK